MPDEITPRWTDPYAATDLGDAYDALARAAGDAQLRFSREFTTRLFVVDDGWTSLTELDDDFHSMRVALRIATDGTIESAGGRMLRNPYETCPRALESLRHLAGANVVIAGAHNQIKQRVPRTEGCLHIVDMLTVAFRAFRISKGHDLEPHYAGEGTRRMLLNLMPTMRDTCVSFAVDHG